MSAMVAALKEAGIHLPPLTKRVWVWLKDHKESTAKEVGCALGITPVAVSQTLYNLAARNMVYKTSEFRKYDRRRVFVFSVRAPEGEYQLLPKTEKAEKGEQEPEEAKGTENTSTGEVKKQVDEFTVAQAREMYEILHKLFGNKS